MAKTSSSIHNYNDAYMYLAQRGAVIPGKTYTEKYLLRTARSFEQQEKAGRTPSKQEARGHATAHFSSLEKNGHVLQQVVMEATYNKRKKEINELTMTDMQKLIDKAKALKPGKDTCMLIIYGIIEDERYPAKELHVSFHEFLSQIQKAIKEASDILDFAELMTDLLFSKITAVAIAFPEERGRHGRG